MMYRLEQFGVFLFLSLFATNTYFWFNSYHNEYAVYAFDGSGIVSYQQGYVHLSNPPAMFEQKWKPYKGKFHPLYNITHRMADDLKNLHTSRSSVPMLSSRSMSLASIGSSIGLAG